MAHPTHHPQFPILSIVFGIFAVVTDVSAYGYSFFLADFAHAAAGVSGTIATILGLIALYEKYIKKK